MNSSMRPRRSDALLVCAAAIVMSMAHLCYGLEPEAASAPAAASPLAPQQGTAPLMATAAAMEALAKLKAAKVDPPYYVDFPHGQGAPA